MFFDNDDVDHKRVNANARLVANAPTDLDFLLSFVDKAHKLVKAYEWARYDEVMDNNYCDDCGGYYPKHTKYCALNNFLQSLENKDDTRI